MNRIIATSVLVLLVTACGAPSPPPEPLRPPTRYVPPPLVQQTPRPRAPDRSDMCGAKPLQTLVGKPRTEIPVPVDPNSRRVTCTTCPVTQDYRPDRLNIVYDAETGIIREVKCG